MSIVAVHGPNTFGSKALLEAGPVLTRVSPTNGLIWDFSLDDSTTRPDQDFSWAFPSDGTPTPQTVADPTPVTYASAGSKTATLTVSNTSRTVSNKALTNNVATLTTTATHGFKVGQSVTVAGVDATFNGTYTIASTPSGTTFTYPLTAANVASTASGGTVTSATTGYPAAGSYPITLTAIAGTGPQTGLMSAPSGGEEPSPEESESVPSPAAGEVPPEETGYDPGEHTVDEVVTYAEAHPDDVGDLLAAEEMGKNRSTLIARLETMIPFDPADYTVSEVIDYVDSNPDELEDVLAAEKAGKNRSTLVTQLEGMRAT